MSRPVEERERTPDPQLLSLWENIRDIDHLRSITYYKDVGSIFHPSSYRVGRKEVAFSFIYEKPWRIFRLLKPMNYALREGVEPDEEDIKLFLAGTAGMTILDPIRNRIRRRRDFAISRNAEGLVCVVLESQHRANLGLINPDVVNPLANVSVGADLYRQVLAYRHEADDNPHGAFTRGLVGGEVKEMETIAGIALPFVRTCVPTLRVLPYEHFVRLG